MNIVELVANLLTTVASGIAIYLFVFKRHEISAAFKLLLNYSYQTTLTELKEKLERLNEYNASEPSDLPEIKNILHEIAGQIKGNSKLKAVAPTIADRLESLASGKRLTEPQKRSLVSELREVLRNIQVNNYSELTGNDHE